MTSVISSIDIDTAEHGPSHVPYRLVEPERWLCSSLRNDLSATGCVVGREKGADNADVYGKDLGLKVDRMEVLRKAGVI